MNKIVIYKLCSGKGVCVRPPMNSPIRKPSFSKTTFSVVTHVLSAFYQVFLINVYLHMVLIILEFISLYYQYF